MKARLVAYLVTLWAVLTLNFLLPRLLPGDPLSALLDPESSYYVFNAELRAALEAYYGLDRPLPAQYAAYLKGAATGDLGRSIRLNKPVGELLAAHLPWTLLLTGTALGLASLFGLLGGAEAANEGSYEILITGFGGLGADADQLRRNFASSSQSTGFSRALGYSNAEFDAPAGAQVTMTDPTEREAALDQMQAILAHDLPALALYYTARVVVYNAEILDNWYFTPGGYGGGIPQPYNKHQYIVGVPEGLAIRSSQ
jgi:hypothetical protein